MAIAGQPWSDLHGEERRKVYNREWKRNAYQADPSIREQHRRYRQGLPPEIRWARKLRYDHKMTPADYEAMWAAQAGCCYLCREPMSRDEKVCIEHDHRCCPPTKSCAICRRGLSHESCNWVIGHAHDDPDLLRRIADNLEIAIKLLNVDGR